MKRLNILVFVCAFLVPVIAKAEQITVAAAANVQFTLDEISAEFTKETSIEVKKIISSSGKLTAQIEQGAPFDVFMSADEEYPKRIYSEGLALGSPKIYAHGFLVLWTLKDIDLSKGIDILKDGIVQKIAIANPSVAPYGRQSVNVMKFNHLYPAISSKLVYGESISQANQFITTKAVDVGFTAKSIVLSPNMAGQGRWVDIDPASYQPIAQAVVIIKHPKQNLPLSQQFYNFLFSSKAKEIFKKYGYAVD